MLVFDPADEWMRDAACRDLDPTQFDTRTPTSELVCPGCPVLEQCRAARMHPAQQRPPRAAPQPKAKPRRHQLAVDSGLRAQHARFEWLRAAGEPIPAEVRAGERQYQQARHRERRRREELRCEPGRPVDGCPHGRGGHVHGQHSTYSTECCRGAACRAANTAYKTALRRRAS